MVSANIAANTIVNSDMHHCSFLQTMQQKWDLGSLGPRQETAPPFTEVFTPTARDHKSWPDWKAYPGPSSTVDEGLLRSVDLGDAPLNDLQKSILDAIAKFYADDPLLSDMGPALSTAGTDTVRDAKEFLERIKKLRHPRPLLGL